jgi:peptide/nickel transport system substrate-binding protein
VVAGLLAKRCQNWDMTNPRCVDYPALNPWIGSPSGNPSLMRWERNPYYFKVDTQGQQLPYIRLHDAHSR